MIITPSYVMTLHRSDEDSRYVITRRKNENNTLPKAGKCCVVSGFSHIRCDFDVVELFFSDSSLSNIPHLTRTKRSTLSKRYVELMLVADRYTTEAYGSFTEQYLLSIAYLVSVSYLLCHRISRCLPQFRNLHSH